LLIQIAPLNGKSDCMLLTISECWSERKVPADKLGLLLPSISDLSASSETNFGSFLFARHNGFRKRSTKPPPLSPLEQIGCHRCAFFLRAEGLVNEG